MFKGFLIFFNAFWIGALCSVIGDKYSQLHTDGYVALAVFTAILIAIFVSDILDKIKAKRTPKRNLK